MGIKTRRINADTDVNNLNKVKVVNPAWDAAAGTGAIAAGSIVYVTGMTGIKMNVAVAGASTTGFMMTTLHEIQAEGHASTGWVIVDMDTSSGTVGDKVWQGVGGAISLFGGTDNNFVGYIIVDAVAGQVAVCPSQASPRTSYIWTHAATPTP